MKVKHKTTGQLGFSGKFNVHSLSEIVVYFEDGDCTSDYLHDYQFYLESSGEWVDFSDKRIIPDNYHTEFKEASSQEEIERGYY